MEKFSIKWNDFYSNVSKSFNNLRIREDFSDVTLVGDDFKQIAAHKIILSSCSQYFNNILKNFAMQKHPILCLDGMSSEDIRKVLDYIYYGELKIYQDEIDRFMVVGQRLGLEGLIEQTNSTKESTVKKENHALQDNEYFNTESSDVEVRVIKKSFLASSHDPTIISFAEGSSINSIEELDNKVEESYSRDNDGSYLCLYCQKTFRNSGHIREHVEVHFDGLSFNCNYCENTFRSRNNLRRHVKKHHS